QNRKERFEAVALELVEDNSGEDGTSYQLQATAADGAPLSAGAYRTGHQRRTIYRQSDDATEPRNFGVWLSQRCQVPFADLTKAEAKSKLLQALKEQLGPRGPRHA